MQTNQQTPSSPPTKPRLRLGTRASSLARWQADWVAARLAQLGAEVETVLITTGGDVTTTPISAAGGQGLFTKEIQRALLEDRIDVAVHSLKDLPTEPVEGLVVAAVPPREDPSDVLVSNVAGTLQELPRGAGVGTGSRRRQSQLLHLRSDLQVRDIRGNVDTRLRKLDEGRYDAVILAQAGLKRLGLEERIAQIIPPSVILPAVGQGALGIEARRDDAETLAILGQLNDAAAHAAVLAERTMLAELRGGCLAPVGAHGRVEAGELFLDAVVLSVDGRRRVAASARGTPADAASIGRQVAGELIEQGAGELIAMSRAANS